jgi:hypothetical protein
VFSFLKMGVGNGSLSIPLASYFQHVEFDPLFHIRKEGLATKAVSVIELQSRVCRIP